MFCVLLTIVEGARHPNISLSSSSHCRLRYFCKKYQTLAIYNQNLYRSVVLFILVIREVRGVKKNFLPTRLPTVLLVHGLLGSLPFLCSALSTIINSGGSQTEEENNLDLRRIFLFISESEFCRNPDVIDVFYYYLDCCLLMSILLSMTSLVHAVHHYNERSTDITLTVMVTLPFTITNLTFRIFSLLFICHLNHFSSCVLMVITVCLLNIISDLIIRKKGSWRKRKDQNVDNPNISCCFLQSFSRYFTI